MSQLNSICHQVNSMGSRHGMNKGKKRSPSQASRMRPTQWNQLLGLNQLSYFTQQPFERVESQFLNK